MHFVFIRFSSMGDVVLQTSIFAWLKLNFPESRITLITSSEFKDLVENHKFIDTVISYKKLRGIADVKSLWKLAREIKGDVIIDLHNTLRAKLLKLALFRLPQVTVSKRTFQRFLLVKLKINTLKNLESHHTRIINDLSFIFDTDFDLEELEEFILKKTSNKDMTLTTNSVSFLEKLTPVISSKYIVISPVASFQTKLWPINYYLELCNKILLDESFLNYEIVIIGGPNDLACKQFDSIESVRIHNYQGKTSFMESSQIIAGGSLTITNDTGVAHLSESFGIGVLSFFGPTSPDFGFRPHLLKSKVLYKDIKCSPCSATGSKACSQSSLLCMEGISTDEAYIALKQMELS